MKRYFPWVVLTAIISSIGIFLNGYLNLHYDFKTSFNGALSGAEGWAVVLVLFALFAFFWDRSEAKAKEGKLKNKKKPSTLTVKSKTPRQRH